MSTNASTRSGPRIAVGRCAITAMVGCALWACSAGTANRRELVAHEAPLTLHGEDAEVWAFRIIVRGEASSGEALSSCTVLLEDAGRPALVEGSRFTADVTLREGVNVVHARCASARGELRSASVRYTVRLAATPVARAHASARDAALFLDGSESRPNEHSGAELTDYAWYEAGLLGGPARNLLARGPRVELPIPAGDGERVFELQVTDRAGRTGSARVQVAVRDGVADELTPGERPTWLRQTIVYGVVPPLFGDPPLRAVTARLEHLARLGVTAVWLSPVFEAPDDDYGYAVKDYFAVREDFGTEQDLEQLVARAHQLGLRVLLDLVPNHTSAEHPYFAQAQALGPRSHYFGYYVRNERGRATHYFDWKHLPNLSYDNVEVRRFMIAASEHWVRQLDVDGYRVDAIWGVAARNPDALVEWADALFRARPDAILIAEGSARDPYYAHQRFAAAYDWTEQPGHWAWQDVFTHEPGIARRLNAAVLESARRSPPDRVLRFINNNDTGARFITRHGEAMTRAATAALMTLPGVPCLFSFDEVGAAFEPYAAVEPVQPSENEGLRAWHARLIALRKSHAALHGPGFEPLHVGDGDEPYVFLRTGESAEAAVVALSFSDRVQTVEVAFPADLARRPNEVLHDLLSEYAVPVRSGKARIEVPAFGVRVLEPR